MSAPQSMEHCNLRFLSICSGEKFPFEDTATVQEDKYLFKVVMCK